jgi:hypothetical protein
MMSAPRDASTRRRNTGERSPTAGPERNIHSIVLIDIAGSASRAGLAYRRMRDDLYGIVDDIPLNHGRCLDAVAYQDHGDGLCLIVPLDVLEPTRIVDTFVSGLRAGLREHRRYVSAAARIRLRVCFDLGLVERHRANWSGDVMTRAARLVDAEPVREALLSQPEENLVGVVSDDLYRSVVCHGFGAFGPDRFREIDVKVKEYSGAAWILEPAPAEECHTCGYR